MSYRFLRINTFYTDFIDQYYARFTDTLKHLSYEQQKQHLLDQHFWSSHYYELNFEKIGVEADLIISNATLLQHTWAQENKLNTTDLTTILLAQIKAYSPQILYIQEAIHLNGALIEEIRNQAPSIKAVIGWCGAVFQSRHIDSFKGFDALGVPTPFFTQQLSSYGIKTFELAHAFEPSVLPLIKKTDPHCDVFFSGSVVSKQGFHTQRLHILKTLVEKKIQVQLRISACSNSKAKLQFQSLLFDLFHKSPKTLQTPLSYIFPFNKVKTWLHRPSFCTELALLKPYTKPPLYGLESLQALANSRIGFNAHIDIAGPYAANLRLFETTGVGTCLVTDHKDNLSDFFEPDREVISYKTPEEAIEKITWLLEHPDSLTNIAKAGQKRTLETHTYLHRVHQLNEIFKAFV